MTKNIALTAVAATLLTGSLGVTAAEGTPVEVGTDSIGVDFYQQNDFYTTGLNRPESTADFYERQVNWMLDNDYPPASIMMSSVGRGMTLADTAFFMAKARPDEAESFYELALDVMPAMPGWACSSESGMANRYSTAINPGDLPENPSLEQLSNLYFDEGKRFMEYPEWRENEGQVNISVDELLKLKEQELELAGRDSWWYRPDKRVSTDVIMATFYPDSRRVVIDARQAELEKMREAGTGEAPVMVLYAEKGQIPMSDLKSDDAGDDNQDDNGGQPASSDLYDDLDISASDVISRFAATGERASPTRDWHSGDSHMRVQVEELQDLFDIPSKDDTSEEDWQRWEQELDKREGMTPMRMSLYEGAGDDRWLDQKGLVAVAAERNIESLPVVFFYHANQRQPCSLPAACADQVQEAITRGAGLAGDVANIPQRGLTGPLLPPLPPSKVSPN